MNKYTAVIILYLERFMDFIILNGVFNLYFYYKYNTSEQIFWSWLFVIPFTVLFLLRQLTDNKQKSMLLQLAAAGLLVLFFYLFFNKVYFIYELYAAVILLVLHAFLFITDEVLEVILIWFGISFNVFFAFIYTIMTKHSAMLPLFILNLSLSIFVRYAHMYFCRLEEFVQTSGCREQPGKHVSMVCSSSFRLFVLYVMVLICVFTVVLSMDYSGISFSKPKPPAEIERFVLKNKDYIYLEDPPSEGYEILESDDVSRYARSGDSPEYNERGQRLKQTVFFIISAATAIIMAVLFYERAKPEIYVDEFGDIDEVESYIPEKRKKLERIHVHGSNQEVRRIFIKKVREHMKNGLIPKKSSTAQRISQWIGETEDIEDLNKLYHRARYSGEVVRKSEIKS